MEELVPPDPEMEHAYELVKDEKYAGTHVMIVEGKVVGFGKKSSELKGAMEKYKGKLAIMLYVPSKDDPTLMVL